MDYLGPEPFLAQRDFDHSPAYTWVGRLLPTSPSHG